ncbi:MAG TPA: methyltransferase domain-containing protein [Draconibacterium sp.]|nr:methyltransferase domain-containing protein [Draconibacterium sp.]
MNDPFGEAIYDYFENGKAPSLTVNSNYTKGEKIAASYFFRTEKEMPAIELSAMKNCKGKILDIGAAAGCHAIILQRKGFNVTALEKSEKAAEVLKKRGIQKVVCNDIFSYSENTFDTILLLMNGAGIGETVAGLEKLLVHLKTFLTEKGQILIDSTDIKYLFEEKDGSVWIDLANDSYYGEMEYEVKYKQAVSNFKWLFIDFETLKKVAKKAGLVCVLIENGKNHDFLAQLKLKLQ